MQVLSAPVPLEPADRQAAENVQSRAGCEVQSPNAAVLAEYQRAGDIEHCTAVDVHISTGDGDGGDGELVQRRISEGEVVPVVAAPPPPPSVRLLIEMGPV